MKISGFIVLVAVALVSVAEAQAQPVMYGSLGGAAAGADDGGAIVTIDQVTGDATVLGTPMPGWGLPGLSFGPTGRLYAVTANNLGNAKLIEVDPDTGGLVSIIGDLLWNGVPTTVTDLGFQPGTGTLYGMTGFNGPGQNSLVTIDTATGAVTLVDNCAHFPGTAGGFVAIAFAPDGTLWAKDTNASNLWTLDPSDCSPLTLTSINPAVGGLGLGARPTDSLLFFTECCVTIGNDVYSLDGPAAAAVLLGPAGGTRRVHDIDFRDAAVPTMKPWGLTALAAFLLLLLATAALWGTRAKWRTA